MEQIAQDRLEKIARMVVYDVPHTQIARATGISASRVSQITESDEFKELIQSIASERFEQDKSVNDGWDHLEATALNIVLDKMQWNGDPEFALKAAMMANRANRRGQFNNRPLDGRDGVRAVIHLRAQFIDKLQQNHFKIANTVNAGVRPVLNLQKRTNGDAGDAELEQKRQDFLPPERIEELFLPTKEENDNELLEFFPHQRAIGAAE